MSNLTAKPRRIAAKDLYRAFATGLAVGLIVWLMAQARPGNPNTLMMSIVFVAAASASLVCYTLGGTPGTAALKARSHEVYAWLCAIGGGILLSLHIMDFLLAGV
jgi:spore maturation protein SpmB